jgi:hypothetical protein
VAEHSLSTVNQLIADVLFEYWYWPANETLDLLAVLSAAGFVVVRAEGIEHGATLRPVEWAHGYGPQNGWTGGVIVDPIDDGLPDDPTDMPMFAVVREAGS